MTDVIVNANLTFLMTKKFEPKFIQQVAKRLALIIRLNPRWRNEELIFFFTKKRVFWTFQKRENSLLRRLCSYDTAIWPVYVPHKAACSCQVSSQSDVAFWKNNFFAQKSHFCLYIITVRVN